MYTYIVILNLFELSTSPAKTLHHLWTEFVKWDTFDTMVKKMSYLWQMYPFGASL